MKTKIFCTITLILMLGAAYAAAQTNSDADIGGDLQSVPPYIEKKWELYDEDPTLGGTQIYYDDMPVEIIKCAAACDDNSEDNIVSVGAVIVHDVTGNIIDVETLDVAKQAYCTGTFECCDVLHAIQCDAIPGCYSDVCSGSFCCQGTATVDCNWLLQNESADLNIKCDGLAAPEEDLPGCTFVPDDDCWTTVDIKDPEFREKYENELCQLYIGSFLMNPDLPAVMENPPGWYTVTVTATDEEAQTGELSNQFEYKSVTIAKPKVIKKWEISELGTDPRGQVTPVPCDNNTVTKCAVMMDSDGAADIALVTAKVVDPSGVIYDQENLTLDAAGLCAGSPELLQQEVLDCLASNTCAVYSGTFDMLYNDTPGTYTVTVGGKDSTGIPAVESINTFAYKELVVLDLDANFVNFGSLIPGEVSWVEGDFDMATLAAPTLKNCGNVMIDVDIDVNNMTCTTPGTCDADFIPEANVDQHLNGGLWSGYGDHCYGSADLMPTYTVDLDVSAHPQLGLLPGNYRGDIVATAVPNGGC